MVIGVTGSRKGMNDYQINMFGYIVQGLEVDVFRHGVCTGTDETSSIIMRNLRPDTYIIGHPPLLDTHLSNSAVFDALEDKYEYLERNKHIVDNSNLLVGIPDTDKEKLRSGTWSTIRYAKKKGVKVIILYPERVEVIDNI